MIMKALLFGWMVRWRLGCRVSRSQQRFNYVKTSYMVFVHLFATGGRWTFSAFDEALCTRYKATGTLCSLVDVMQTSN
jgi:hypothetical protein